MNREKNKVIPIDEEMKKFNTNDMRLKYISEEIETYRKELREMYVSRKDLLSREIENYVFFETILKIIEKYFINTLESIKEMKNIINNLIEIYDFDKIQNTISEYKVRIENNNVMINNMEKSLYGSKLDRPMVIYTYEIKRWMEKHNSYYHKFIELLNFFEYEEF